MVLEHLLVTAYKMKFCIKDFGSKCDQIRMKLHVVSVCLVEIYPEYFSAWTVITPKIH